METSSKCRCIEKRANEGGMDIIFKDPRVANAISTARHFAATWLEISLVMYLCGPVLCCYIASIKLLVGGGVVRQDHLMERMLETGRSRASSHKLTGECLCIRSGLL